MIDVFPFAGYPVALYGLDDAGLFTARALHAAEAELSAWDDAPENRAKALDSGLTPINFSDKDLRDYTTLVLSAAAFSDDETALRLATRARAQNVEVICDTELLARTQREAAYVGISGKNGKSLTAALVTYILQVTGREAEMAGLSGTSALNTDPLGMEGAYVLEMTPFRLDHTVSITFDVAVLLNLGEDEDDDETTAMQIFHRQTDPRAAVVSVDDGPSQSIFNSLSKAAQQRVFPFSTVNRIRGGVFVESGTLYDSIDEADPVPVMDLSAIPALAGPHAQANVAAAFAAVRAIGVQPHAAMAAINSFPGLVDHREEIARIDGRLYINDAASTSLSCAASSFQGYDHLHWIGGGETANDSQFPDTKIEQAYLFGAGGNALAKVIDDQVPFTLYETLEQALAAASTGETPATIIFAPGCPTPNGDAFRDLVQALPGTRDDED